MMDANFFCPTRPENLVIANRDPAQHEVYAPFWLNWNTKELFHFQIDKWVSLSYEYVKNVV